MLAPNSYQSVLVCAEPSVTFLTNGLFWATAIGGGVDSQQYALFNLTITIKQISDMVSITKPFETGACTGDSNIATVNVSNTGNLFGAMPDAYTASITGANARDFTVESPNPTAAVTAGNSAGFSIRYIPSTDSLESASLWVTRSSDGKVSGPYGLRASGGGRASIAGDTTAYASPMQSVIFSLPIHNTGTCTWTPGIPTVTQEDSAFALLEQWKRTDPSKFNGVSRLYLYAAIVGQLFCNALVSEREQCFHSGSKCTN